MVLIAVLCRYAAWSTSSCGVERNFFKAKWAVESRKAWLSDELYNDEMKVLCDASEADGPGYAAAARKHWVEMGYGPSKGPYRLRLDKGLKRKRTAETKSLAAWLNRRRASVETMLSNIGVPRETAKVVKKMGPGGQHWNKELDDEVAPLSFATSRIGTVGIGYPLGGGEWALKCSFRSSLSGCLRNSSGYLSTSQEDVLLSGQRAGWSNRLGQSRRRHRGCFGYGVGAKRGGTQKVFGRAETKEYYAGSSHETHFAGQGSFHRARR